MASKRLNRKLVIGLTLLTFLSMIALSLLMLLHLQKGDPDQLADIAKRHQEAGEWRQATYFYHRADRQGGGVHHVVAAGARGRWREASTAGATVGAGTLRSSRRGCASGTRPVNGEAAATGRGGRSPRV